MRIDPRHHLAASLAVVLAAGLLWLGLTGAAPREIVVASRVDKVRLTMEEPLTFSVTITGPVTSTPRITLPSLEGFAVLSTGQSQQANIRAGETQLSVTLQYILAPTAPGKQTLGPVTVEHEGQRYQTVPIEVEVTGAPRPPVEPPTTPRRPAMRGGTVL